MWEHSKCSHEEIVSKLTLSYEVATRTGLISGRDLTYLISSKYHELIEFIILISRPLVSSHGYYLQTANNYMSIFLRYSEKTVLALNAAFKP